MRTVTACCLAALLTTGLSAAADAPKVEKVDPKSAAAQVEKGTASLVDVREEDEVTSGMAKPAKWFPLSKVNADPAAFKAFLAALPKGKVVFYCAAGGRAGKAAEKAAALGYTTANMGGYSDWAAAGLPTKDKP
ncbi:MAG: sulfurtransferase [Archangiaceae bacterium]|nr:sulfurtransferase [Archangiaceae bacterium]